MQKSDFVRLRHMLDAAKEALSFITGRSRSDLDKDRMLVLSLVKDIEIIGEAASKVSLEVSTNTPDIPWMDIVDMRNHLIHAYFNVDLDIVWDTVIKDLPSLISALEKIIHIEENPETGAQPFT
ncbi:MAG: HepT-like ribonuclease domain-containing protein [Candidatus Brocadiales bacterium]